MHLKHMAAFLSLLTAGAVANAYEIRVRFVERVGSADVELLEGNQITAAEGELRRVRIQFGAFDDSEGPAPYGGYVGWNVGTITVNGGAANSDESRDSALGRGRLAPFAFAPAGGGANGVPAGDPFEALTGIDNTRGIMHLVWYFGQPRPQPEILGLNTWVSTFEFTIRPNVGATDYSIDIGGNVLAALEWREVSGLYPPKDEDTPGGVTVAPFPDAPRQFGATLHVTVVPAPGVGVALVLAGALPRRRRRGGNSQNQCGIAPRTRGK
jgi:hypothetical protein